MCICVRSRACLLCSLRVCVCACVCARARDRYIQVGFIPKGHHTTAENFSYMTTQGADRTLKLGHQPLVSHAPKPLHTYECKVGVIILALHSRFWQGIVQPVTICNGGASCDVGVRATAGSHLRVMALPDDAAASVDINRHFEPMIINFSRGNSVKRSWINEACET